MEQQRQDERAEANPLVLALAALERPDEVEQASVAACADLLGRADLPPAALGALAAVAAARPELLGDEVVAGLEALFGTDPAGRPEAAYRQAGALLGFLLATPAAPRAVDLLLGLLGRAGLPAAAYEALLEALEYAAAWAISRLDLEALVGLAERPTWQSGARRCSSGRFSPTRRR